MDTTSVKFRWVLGCWGYAIINAGVVVIHGNVLNSADAEKAKEIEKKNGE
jgi:hypothetical protein